MFQGLSIFEGAVDLQDNDGSSLVLVYLLA